MSFFNSIKHLSSTTKYFIAFMLFLCAFVIINKIERESFWKIRENYSVTTGIITQYIVGSNLSLPSKGLSSSKNKITFEYKIEGKIYTNSYPENPFVEIPDVKPDFQYQYIVLYQKGEPQNSCLLVNYPIKNEVEKDLYIKQFQNGLPVDAFLQ